MNNATIDTNLTPKRKKNMRVRIIAITLSAVAAFSAAGLVIGSSAYPEDTETSAAELRRKRTEAELKFRQAKNDTERKEAAMMAAEVRKAEENRKSADRLRKGRNPTQPTTVPPR